MEVDIRDVPCLMIKALSYCGPIVPVTLCFAVSFMLDGVLKILFRITSVTDQDD
jgi:hypothetical protein